MGFTGAGRWDTLDKQEGLVLRGAGILLIMLHNFTHWVPPVTGENEFSFEAPQVATMFAQLRDTPIDAWRILFSYFGHYGVQLFVFLSAYGLTRSCANHVPGYGAFLLKRIGALFPAVILAALLFLAYSGIFSGPAKTFGEDFVPLVRQLLLIGNFTGGGFTPIGPWWFLSMICQFYLVFPWLHRGMARFGSPFLFVTGSAALLLEVTCNAWITATTPTNLNYTVLGHLAEFCFGMWAASRGNMRAPLVWGGVALVVFFAGQWHPIAWTVAGLAFTLLAVPPLRRLARNNSRSTSVLTFFGTISLPLFLVNGFLRSPLVWYAQLIAERNVPLAWLCTIALSLAFISWSVFWAWSLHWIVQKRRIPTDQTVGDR